MNRTATSLTAGICFLKMGTATNSAPIMALETKNFT